MIIFVIKKKKIYRLRFNCLISYHITSKIYNIIIKLQLKITTCDILINTQ